MLTQKYKVYFMPDIEIARLQVLCFSSAQFKFLIKVKSDYSRL